MLEMVRHLVAHKAHRFWLLPIQGSPFVLEDESRPADSFDALIQRYDRTHAQEGAWLTVATDGDLTRMLEHALIPGSRREALRRHGGVPPATDFILWLAERP